MVTTIMIHKKIEYNNSTIAFVTVLMKRYMFPVIVVLTSGFQFSLNLTFYTFIFSWQRNTKPYQEDDDTQTQIMVGTQQTLK